MCYALLSIPGTTVPSASQSRIEDDDDDDDDYEDDEDSCEDDDEDDGAGESDKLSFIR